ncbi:DUF4129 domain-containing protein [Archangium violaceum]|uniref:DUF4129 domain-containing protein n=1 Tax=Archangium violaceum TaxID=83451 RepID=UPI00193C1A05|nr:DUF4129 domain-containing protein [Archangium violaceum]QRK05765.1 DUF4129 domain-containing protein [Archangium violaceum]
MISGLALLWLAALPCEDSARELQQLTEVAERAPEALDEELEALESRWEGLPLRSPDDQTPAERVETAAGRIQGACTRLEAERGSVTPLPRSDRARLQEILSRPEFAQARQRNGDVLQRFFRMLMAWLEELLQTREAQGFATSTRTVVLVLGVGVVLFAVLRLRHWKRGPARRGASVDTDTGPAGALRLDTPGEHLARARTALRAQPRDAIREGLLALLSSLEAKRLARPDRVKTNRELVGELPGRGASAQLTGEVERLVRWYDRAFYSLEPVPSEDAARFVDEVERLHQGLAGAAA